MDIKYISETHEKKAFYRCILQNRGVFIVLFFLFSLCSSAQKISVEAFYYAQSDLTANRAATAVFDQNGEKCALIRVQTTQKGFVFDVGSLGVTKVDDSHTGEIWIFVPNGVKHLDIRHAKLGSLIGYEFPENIRKGNTYILELFCDLPKTEYNDSLKQWLDIDITVPNAELTLNGMQVELDKQGHAEKELSFGLYAYNITAKGYYSKKGQIEINDKENRQKLEVSDLRPIVGSLNLLVEPRTATISIDSISVATTPVSLQIGTHEVTVKSKGYKTEVFQVTIEENKTKYLHVPLSRDADFRITTVPEGARVYINKELAGTTPFTKTLSTGTYSVKAKRRGYRNFSKNLELDASDPNLELPLKRVYNYKNEFYLEGNARIGGFLGTGGTMGFYAQNVNFEFSFMYDGRDKSAPVYWNSNENGVQPIEATYSPKIDFSVKLGYGITLGSRLRLTPQAGVNFLKISEQTEESNSRDSKGYANGANVASAVVSLRVSFAILRHLAISVTPEYLFPKTESKGYMVLSEISDEIAKWGKGFKAKFGLVVIF